MQLAVGMDGGRAEFIAINSNTLTIFMDSGIIVSICQYK